MRKTRSCSRLGAFLLIAFALAAVSEAGAQVLSHAARNSPLAWEARPVAVREDRRFSPKQGPQLQTATFLTDQRIPAGTRPNSVAAGHFDPDDRLDLVTSNGPADSISVFTQLHDGGFSRRDLPVGDAPACVVAGDVTGDGFDDLAVVLEGEGSVLLLVADGAGGFVEEGRYPVGRAPTSAVFSDLDRDGDIDLACSNGGDSTVTLLRNTRNADPGPGRALAAWSTLVIGPRPDFLVAGDFNRDGRPDLAAMVHEVSPSHTVARPLVLLGPGGDDFALIDHPRILGGPNAMVAADFDGDSDLDLGVAVDGGVYVLGNDGAGHLTSGPLIESPAFMCPGLAAADVDGDGDVDLLVASWRTLDRTQSMLSVFLNTDGTFHEEVGMLVGYIPAEVITCDLNGDGRPDVVTANYGSYWLPGVASSLSLLVNRGHGRFEGVERRFIRGLSDDERWWGTIRALERPGHSPRHLTDLLFVTRTDARLMRNAGGGAFGEPVVVIPHPIAATVDLTGDGVTDAIARVESGLARVFIGDRDGGFEPADDFVLDAPHMILNLDRDRLPDILLLSDPIRALDNLGRGRFGPAREVPGAGVLAGNIRRWAIDMDDDGRDEIWIVRSPYDRADSLIVIERGEDGSFREGPRLPVPTSFDDLSPWQGAALPNTPDGGTDIAFLFGCSGCDASGLLMIHRHPDGRLEVVDVRRRGVGMEYARLHLDDLDGDGRGDVVVAAGAGNVTDEGVVRVFRNLGHGRLEKEQEIPTDLRITGSALADFDGDRRLELVGYSSNRSELLHFRAADGKAGNREGQRADRPKRSPLDTRRPATPAMNTALLAGGRLVFALPVSGPAHLTLYDLAGRRVLSRDLGWLAAGEHALELPELGTLRAGIYWARVGARGAETVGKVVVLGR